MESSSQDTPAAHEDAQWHFVCESVYPLGDLQPGSLEAAQQKARDLLECLRRWRTRTGVQVFSSLPLRQAASFPERAVLRLETDEGLHDREDVRVLDRLEDTLADLLALKPLSP